MEQKGEPRSVLYDPNVYEETLEELHNSQAPGVYSELGKEWGWSEEPVPPYLIERIMEEIYRFQEEVEVNRRVMFSVGCLLLVLTGAMLFTLVEALNTLGQAERAQVLTGIFWMVASLVGSGSVLSVFFLRYHEREHDEGYSLHPVEKLLRRLRFRK